MNTDYNIIGTNVSPEHSLLMNIKSIEDQRKKFAIGDNLIQNQNSNQNQNEIENFKIKNREINNFKILYTLIIVLLFILIIINFRGF